MDIVNGTLFSKGLYSSWCHLPQFELMFDAGEGAATYLENDLANVTRIFIGHHHGDHTLGLPSIIGCRNMCQGMSRNPETRGHNKPLEIFYPKNSGRESMRNLLGFIEERNGSWLRYDIKFTAIEPGFELEIAKNTFVQSFRVLHDKNHTCLGYRIIEKRKKLKVEFIGEDIAALKRSGFKGEVMEHYTANLFAYVLDAYGIPNESILTDCKTVVMDCTFVDPIDRDDPTHFTLDEATDLCIRNRVGAMIVGHVSPRYDSADVSMKVSKLDWKNGMRVLYSDYRRVVQF
jgi:ribonuclease Z